MKTDDSLAAVLAHELAHLAHKDHFKPRPRGSGEALQRELAADALGMRFMQAAGIPAEAMVSALRAIEDVQPRGLGRYSHRCVSTDPTTAPRGPRLRPGPTHEQLRSRHSSLTSSGTLPSIPHRRSRSFAPHLLLLARGSRELGGGYGIAWQRDSKGRGYYNEEDAHARHAVSSSAGGRDVRIRLPDHQGRSPGIGRPRHAPASMPPASTARCLTTRTTWSRPFLTGRVCACKQKPLQA